MAIRLVVGLGNPGSEYVDTRHNVGFWWVEGLARQLKLNWAAQGKFFGNLARDSDISLLQPATFMNRSGQAVLAFAQFYKILPDEILVVHDDLDLAPGEIRVKQGGGSGGHNGIKDIQARLSTPDFWRLRLGVGHPRSLGLSQPVADFVLHRPRPEEQIKLELAIERSLAEWPDLSAANFANAAQRLHRKQL